MTTTAELLYAPVKRSGRITLQSDIHATEAEIHSTVFFAARNCSMADYNTLVPRGIKVLLKDLFSRFSLASVGSGTERQQKTGVSVPLSFDEHFTRVHRSSLNFDVLELKRDIEYEFVYADNGEPLSDVHARVVGRIYLVMNYRGHVY